MYASEQVAGMPHELRGYLDTLSPSGISHYEHAGICTDLEASANGLHVVIGAALPPA